MTRMMAQLPPKCSKLLRLCMTPKCYIECNIPATLNLGLDKPCLATWMILNQLSFFGAWSAQQTWLDFWCTLSITEQTLHVPSTSPSLPTISLRQTHSISTGYRGKSFQRRAFFVLEGLYRQVVAMALPKLYLSGLSAQVCSLGVRTDVARRRSRQMLIVAHDLETAFRPPK